MAVFWIITETSLYLWNCFKIKLNNNNNKKVTLCREVERKRPWGQGGKSKNCCLDLQRGGGIRASAAAAPVQGEGWGVWPAQSSNSESPSCRKYRHETYWPEYESLAISINRSSSEKLSGSMRKAAVTALFRFLSRADLRATFSFIATIFTWKKQNIQKKNPRSGVLPNLCVYTYAGTVLNTWPWRSLSIRPVDMKYLLF